MPTDTAKTTSAPSAPPKPRVLIADDSRIVRASIVQHIRDRFDIREVMDGEAAWQAVLLDSSIRVVITDLTMPKVDGFELLNRVRSSKVQRIRELPIVVISGEDEGAERDRAATMGATDFIQKGLGAAELIARLEVLVRLSATREALAESHASLESSRTVDGETELLSMPFFDKQVEKLISFARRNLSDVALICVRVELSMPQQATWEGEVEQRIKLVGRTLAASIRLEDLGTRSDKFEFCVATPSSGLSGVLRFAARLRKVLENVEAAGPGVEVWTCIGLSTLSEELRRSAEELRALAQKRCRAGTAKSVPPHHSRDFGRRFAGGYGSEARGRFDGHQSRAGADPRRPGGRSGAASAPIAGAGCATPETGAATEGTASRTGGGRHAWRSTRSFTLGRSRIRAGSGPSRPR